jgi:long-chain acyl-CoA synthetase
VPTLTSALQRTAHLYRDKIAILDREVTFTWSQFIDRIRRAAGLLRDLGIDKNDRYAILALNSYRQAELIYAGYWIGAIAVPINFRLAAPEIRDILDDAACKIIVIDPQFIQLLEEPELRPWRNCSLYLGSKEDNKNYETLIASAIAAAPVNTLADDEAILLYTGGTTGKSKGVPLSHRNILSNARQIGSIWPASSEDVVLHLPPMFHSAELVKTIYMLNGSANVYLPRFEPELLLQTIEDYRISFVLMVPTIIMKILESGLVDRYDLSSLKQIIYGASPMPAAAIKKTIETFPDVQIAQGYGLTETAPLLTMLDHQSHVAALNSDNHKHLTSCGRALSGVDIKIVDEQDHALPPGSEGEIVVRGENVFGGYLDRPEINAEIFKEDWFYTSDVGYIDEDGYLYLKDRKHDIIMTGGEKVYSSEVEAVIYQHPDIAECAVIGIPDLQYGERVHAVVVTNPGKKIDEEELLDHCRKHIGGYKLPRKIDMLDKLPKNTMGKILKTELRLRCKVN